MDFSSIEQGTPEWHAVKRGRISASEVHRLICSRARLKKGELLSKGAKTYIRKTVGDAVYLPEDKKQIDTQGMQRGIILERAAVLNFEMKFGFLVQKTGFFTFSDWLGCSTDGIVHENKHRRGVLEVKCAETPQIHLHYCTVRNWADIKAISPLLFWQMQLALFITGLKRAWFVAYDPRLLPTKNKHLALFSICLEREQKYITELCDSLGRGWAYMDEFKKTLNIKY